MRKRSRGWTFKRGRTWYIGYFAPGTKTHRKQNCPDVRAGKATQCPTHARRRMKIREATGCTKPARRNGDPPGEVKDLLRQRLNELDEGKWQHPAKPLTFDDLLDLVRDDWRGRGRKSRLTGRDGKKENARVRHLRAAFGHAEAADITALQLARYAKDRFDAGAEISTVRNELNVLKRGMNLARKKDLLAKVPAFPELVPKNVRTGFFERPELDALLAELAEPVRPIVTFMYWTGWRKEEVLSREWRHVDFEAGTIRLDPGETKNGKGRDFPFGLIPELKAVIEGQRTRTDRVERKKGRIVPWVFHREGERVRVFRHAWAGACRRANLSRVPHDFRRTAVRNLVRAGVSEKVAMELTGHLTRSVFERYNITTDRDRRDAVAKLAAAASERQVLPLKRRKAAQV